VLEGETRTIAIWHSELCNPRSGWLQIGCSFTGRGWFMAFRWISPKSPSEVVSLAPCAGALRSTNVDSTEIGRSLETWRFIAS
jgi:hypothetical protein